MLLLMTVIFKNKFSYKTLLSPFRLFPLLLKARYSWGFPKLTSILILLIDSPIGPEGCEFGVRCSRKTGTQVSTTGFL